MVGAIGAGHYHRAYGQHARNLYRGAMHAWKHRHKVRGVAKSIKRGYDKVREHFKRSDKSAKRVRKLPTAISSDNTHSGISTETIRVKAGPLKLPGKQKMLGLWKLDYTFSGILGAGAGTQQCTTIAVLNNNSMLFVSTGGTYSSNGTIQAPYALEQLNPYLTNTGSALIPSVATPLNDRFVLKRNTLKLEMTNFSAVAADIDVYLLSPKVVLDQTKHPDTLLTQAYDSFGVATAVAPAPGVVTNTPGGFLKTIPYVNPMENSSFRTNYKICTVKKIMLEGNSTQFVNFDINVNKVIKKEKWSQLATYALVPGVTYVIMTINRGQLVLDKTNSLTTGTVCTTGSTEIGYACFIHSRACAVSGNADRLNTSFMASGIPANTTVANQSLVNEVDVPTTVATATVPL